MLLIVFLPLLPWTWAPPGHLASAATTIAHPSTLRRLSVRSGPGPLEGLTSSETFKPPESRDTPAKLRQSLQSLRDRRGYERLVSSHIEKQKGQMPGPAWQLLNEGKYSENLAHFGKKFHMIEGNAQHARLIEFRRQELLLYWQKHANLDRVVDHGSKSLKDTQRRHGECERSIATQSSGSSNARKRAECEHLKEEMSDQEDVLQGQKTARQAAWLVYEEKRHELFAYREPACIGLDGGAHADRVKARRRTTPTSVNRSSTRDTARP